MAARRLDAALRDGRVGLQRGPCAVGVVTSRRGLPSCGDVARPASVAHGRAWPRC
jgi:hypothetical protein